MNEFLNISVIWVLLGFAFLLLEFIIPGFILFFFGVGAWIVALLTFFFDISLDVQILIFIISSSLSVLLFRKWLRGKMGHYSEASVELADEFVGRICVTETAFTSNGKGKVTFKGAIWEAESIDALEVGEEAEIIGTKSIVLIIKSTK